MWIIGICCFFSPFEMILSASYFIASCYLGSYLADCRNCSILCNKQFGFWLLNLVVVLIPELLLYSFGYRIGQLIWFTIGQSLVAHARFTNHYFLLIARWLDRNLPHFLQWWFVLTSVWNLTRKEESYDMSRFVLRDDKSLQKMVPSSLWGIGFFFTESLDIGWSPSC